MKEEEEEEEEGLRQQVSFTNILGLF